MQDDNHDGADDTDELLCTGQKGFFQPLFPSKICFMSFLFLILVCICLQDSVSLSDYRSILVKI